MSAAQPQEPLPFEADITANYHRGNPESAAAHESIRANKSARRAAVVANIDRQGPYGSTCYEAVVRLRWGHQSVSARITEAKARGELIMTDRRRPTNTGRQARVYVTPRHRATGSNER